MIGSAREFFVARVLRSILPPSVHIGSGRVFNEEGKRSKQIDVVVYDSRYPVFEVQEGQGLYLIEGTIATIEVRSTIVNQVDLDTAINNGRSVWKLRKETPPPSYVFAFTSRIEKCGTLVQHLEAWASTQELPDWSSTRRQAPVPRVIVAGSIVALTNDDVIDIQCDEAHLRQLNNRLGATASVLMGLWKVKRRFGWLALHLLSQVTTRMTRQTSLEFWKYSPWRLYAEEQLDTATPTALAGYVPTSADSKR
jgi:hypothetical protein